MSDNKLILCKNILEDGKSVTPRYCSGIKINGEVYNFYFNDPDLIKHLSKLLFNS